MSMCTHERDYYLSTSVENGYTVREFVARVLAIPWGPRENHKPPRPPNPLRLKGGQPQDKSGCWAVPGHVWGVGWVAWVGKGRHFPQPSNEPGPKMQQYFTLNPTQPANT